MALQQGSPTPPAKRKRKWGGLIDSYEGACLPTDEALDEFASREKIRKMDLSGWLRKKEVFAARAPGSGYDWHMKHVRIAGVGRVNACSLTLALAYLQVQGHDINYTDLAADIYELHPHQQKQPCADEVPSLSEAAQHLGAELREKADKHQLLQFLPDHRGSLAILVAASAAGGECAAARPPVPPQRPAARRGRQQTRATTAREDDRGSIDADTVCEGCGSPHDDESMLICDRCNLGYHMYCMQPPVEEVPDGDWFCATCMLPNPNNRPGVLESSNVSSFGGLPARPVCGPPLLRAVARLPQPAEQSLEGASLPSGPGGMLRRAQIEIDSLLSEVDRPTRAQPRHEQAPLRAVIPGRTVQEQGIPAAASQPAGEVPGEASLAQGSMEGGISGMPAIPDQPETPQHAAPSCAASCSIHAISASAMMTKLRHCFDLVEAKQPCEAQLIDLCMHFGVDYLLVKGGTLGEVQGASELGVRLFVFLQEIVSKKENTWMQYWPKLQAIVAWLTCNAALTAADMSITEAKFLRFLIDLGDGSFYKEGTNWTLQTGPREVGDPAVPFAMGLSSAKQYNAALAMLQQFQDTIMYGDMMNPSITRSKCVKLTLQHAKKSENLRRHTNLVDAAANAPQLIDESQHMRLVDSYLHRNNKREVAAGLRDLAMHNHCMGTMGRSDEARSKRVCQQQSFNYPIPEDDIGYNGSRQPLQTTIFSLSSGKSNDGDRKDYQAAARHSNVFKCPLGTMALHNVSKHHLSQIAMPDVLGGKKKYYDDVIFAVGTADNPYQAAHQYGQVRNAHAAAGLKKTGQVCHLPRHVSANTARAVYSEACGEVAIAGHWQRNAQNNIYCQLPSGDGIARRAGYSAGRAGAANFRQLLSPMDFEEFVPIVEALFPDLCDQLEEICQRNNSTSCSAKDRDVAGEYVTELYMRDAIIFLQDMPFWYERYPELPLWRIPALQPFWRGPDPLLLKWMNAQLFFVRACWSALKDLTAPFALQLSGAPPQAQLVNALLAQREADGGFAGTLGLARRALDGEDTLPCRLIAEPLKVLAGRSAGLTAAGGVNDAPDVRSPVSLQPPPSSQLRLSPSSMGTEGHQGQRQTPPSVQQRPRRKMRALPSSPHGAARGPSAQARVDPPRALPAGRQRACSGQEVQAASAALMQLGGIAEDPQHGERWLISAAVSDGTPAAQIGLGAALSQDALLEILKRMEAKQETMQQDLRRVKAHMSGQRAEQIVMSEAVQKQSKQASESRVLLTTMMYQGLSAGKLCIAGSMQPLSAQPPASRLQPTTAAARRREATKLKHAKKLEARRAGSGEAVALEAEEDWEPWTSWLGYHHSLAICSMEDIYMDGTKGILMVPASAHVPEQRTLSLLALEERSRGIGGLRLEWRAGTQMRKEVSKRKAIWYALQRRIDDSSEAAPDGELQTALEQLTTVRQEVARSKSAGTHAQQPAKMCSLHQLAEHLLQSEIKPNQYEETVLRWPQHTSMPQGNPRRQ